MAVKSRRIGKKVSYYVPRNWNKYKGKKNPQARSSWERMFMQWLDSNPNVLEWSSESTIIYYYDPIRSIKRRYYPDFYIKILNRDKKIVTYIVELKPYHETNLPIDTGRKSKKTLDYQKTTYIINQAKFKAAEEYCKKLGIRFKLLTEKELFNK